MIEISPEAGSPQRQGKAWTAEEDSQLYDEFVSGQPVDVLASVHERSPGAIRARLRRLGLIDENGEVVEPIPPLATPTRRADAAAPERNAIRPVFAIRTSDGWNVEIRSNRPLSRPLVDRLTSMLHGVLVEDASQ